MATIPLFTANTQARPGDFLEKQEHFYTVTFKNPWYICCMNTVIKKCDSILTSMAIVLFAPTNLIQEK